MPATWGKNTLTNQALTMMNQALGISAITFTKAVTITDDITGDSVSQLQALTSVNYKQSRTPKAIATQDNKSRLGVTIDNSDVNEDYTYYGVGLYAKQNSTNQEVLFSVIPLTAGATMIAKENNATTASIYLDLYTDIVRGTQVTIMVSNSGTLSREDVQQMISQSIGNALNYPNETASIGTDFNAILDISITRIINDTTVVNAPSGFSGTGYLTTIGSGDKTVPIMQTLDDTINNIRSTRYFNSTTNIWSEWNAYAKTVDVNQQLDKKVNVSDMRKPARDVAGIEEVNAKQDKIGYTPADDSKVVHDNHDGTITINGNSFTPSLLDSAIGKNVQPINTDVNTLAKPGIYYVSGSAPNNPFKTLMILEVKIQYDWNGFEGIQIAYSLENKSGIAIRSVNPNGSLTGFGTMLPWVFLSDDSTVVHTADMRKPASDVAGIEEVNAKQDKLTITPADDSKVAHLSGANNFDTVPTVNNNPLLLASSLPSDLARTGSDQEYTGKNTFDTAPIDKKTGNPYITKDGVPAVPSTLADTTKPANFTAGLQSGGVSVATSDDLKSVENSAWHQLNNDKYLGGTLLYKIDQSSKTIHLSYSLVHTYNLNTGDTIADFSSIVKNIKTISGKMCCLYEDSTDVTEGGASTYLSIDSPASIVLLNSLYAPRESYFNFSDGTYFTYDSLVNN